MTGAAWFLAGVACALAAGVGAAALLVWRLCTRPGGLFDEPDA